MDRSERQHKLRSTFVPSTGQICSFGPVRPKGSCFECPLDFTGVFYLSMDYIMCSFTDKKNRFITFHVSDCCVDAYHDGNRVGDLITSGVDDMGNGQFHSARVETWDVHSDYQGAGIGSEMVRLLVEDAGLGPLLPGHKNIGIGGINALTDKGEGFTVYCQKMGYILPFPGE